MEFGIIAFYINWCYAECHLCLSVVNKTFMLCVAMLSINMCRYGECCHAEWHYAGYAECR
jgi:hypothetical protein